MTEDEVRDLFRVERDRFAAVFPKPEVAEAKLAIVNRRCGMDQCHFRDMAWSTWVEGRWGTVSMLRRALEIPRENIVGIIRHELGHLAVGARGYENELRADAAAQFVTGEPIRYDGDQLQTIGPGTWPRPRNLHR